MTCFTWSGCAAFVEPEFIMTCFTWSGCAAFVEPEFIQGLQSLTKESTEDDWDEVLRGFGMMASYNNYAFVWNGDTKEGFPSQRWSVIHHMAYLSAPKEIVEGYKNKGHFLGYKDFEGRTALEHVSNDKDEDYKDLYKPKYKLENIDFDKIKKIEKQFHAVILSRTDFGVAGLIEKNNVILPDLSCYLESTAEYSVFFPVPGMYGGFNGIFNFSEDKKDILSLTTDSFCRIAGGSGESHECTEDKWELTRADTEGAWS